MTQSRFSRRRWSGRGGCSRRGVRPTATRTVPSAPLTRCGTSARSRSCPYDDQHVWLVRQPREASRLTDSLEIPAGKCDRPDEQRIDLAKRELVEEIGKQASEWRELFEFFPLGRVL